MMGVWTWILGFTVFGVNRLKLKGRPLLESKEDIIGNVGTKV
jgi:hypothetical protein